MRARARRPLVYALLLAGASSACNNGEPTPLAPQKGDAINPFIVLTPTKVEQDIGEDTKFSWTVHDGSGSGADITSKYPAFSFQSADEAIAAAGEDGSTPTGDALCVNKGTVAMTASVVGLVGQTPGVAAVQCDSVHADPKFAPMGSDAVQLTVSGVASGKSVSNPTFAWTSTNPAIASVTAGGLATPVSPGSIGVSVTQVAKGKTYPVAIGVFFVTGNGSCSLNPSAILTRSLTIKVQSDPGNHAAQIGLRTTATTLGFALGSFAATNMQIGVSAPAPFVNVGGGWVAPTDCGFVANGMGTVAGQANVGVRLTGVWTNGALNLTYTVGTNGELSGGPTVYSISG